MRECFYLYFDSLKKDVPCDVYAGLLSVLCIGAVVFITWKGTQARKHVIGIMLMEYVFLLLSITVIFREQHEGRAYNFDPLWSYKEIARGERQDLLTENIMNVVVFTPIGVLLGDVIQRKKTYNRWMMVMVFGLSLSLSIEGLQFTYRKGFAELDDVIHNILGCIIGFAAYICAKGTYKKLSKKMTSEAMF